MASIDIKLSQIRQSHLYRGEVKEFEEEVEIIE
jgi:hypothetical protein